MIRNIFRNVKCGNMGFLRGISGNSNYTVAASFSSAAESGDQPSNNSSNTSNPSTTTASPSSSSTSTSQQSHKHHDSRRNFSRDDQAKKTFTPFKQQKNDQGNSGNNNNNNNQNSQGNQNNNNNNNNNNRYPRRDNQGRGQEESGQQRTFNKDNRAASDQNQQSNSQSSHQNQQSGSTGQGNEGQFLSLLNRSEQSRNEKARGANQHQQLLKRLKQYESNGNPTDVEMRSAIECYSSCGVYEKAISTFVALQNVAGAKSASANESVMNAVLDSHIKISPLNVVDAFFTKEFVQANLLKLVYRETIQNYISRLAVDASLSLSDRIDLLARFVGAFTKSDSLATSSFSGIDLSSLSSLFSNANTKEFVESAKILVQLLNLSIGNTQGAEASAGVQSQQQQQPKGSFAGLKISNVEHIRVQLDILNTKNLFSNLYRLKEFDTCKSLVQALSKGGFLVQSSSISASRNNDHQKFIDYSELIAFCIESNRCINFWVDVVAKKIDFEPFAAAFSDALLKIRMQTVAPTIFSVEKLYEFFLNINSYGALSASQVFVLMEISIYLKEYQLAIELFQNHQKYTNRKRDLFVYESMLKVINSLNLRTSTSSSGKQNKDHALQAFRKMLFEAEQQTGKQVGSMTSKLHEIKSHIADQSLESAFSIFNDRFLKESIVNYQSLQVKYFLLLLSEQQDERDDISHSENAIARFVTSLAPKQLIQLWQDSRNESHLARILANKESGYSDFVRRLEIEKYYSTIKRDIVNGMYTIEDRRNNMEGVHLNEYEKYVIENFDTLNPQMTLDSKLKAPVLDGMLKIKKFEEKMSRKEGKKKVKAGEEGSEEAAASEEPAAAASSGAEEGQSENSAVAHHKKDLEDTQIEINKILGRPNDTPVNIPEMFKKFDLEDKLNNRQVERYVNQLRQAEYNSTRIYKMKFMNFDTYKEAVEAFPELVEQAAILARPAIPAEAPLIFDLITWGAENNQPFAIQLGEIYCDLNGIVLPPTLSEKINHTIDPFNDAPEYLNQFTMAKRLIGDINRERVHQVYTHYSQKPQFLQTVNELAKEDRFADEANQILLKELSANRLFKYGIPEKYLMQQITKS